MAKLLIIEDNVDLREAYALLLAEYEIIFALEREEIETVVEQVDLVICDYSFNPVLSFEQVREIVGDKKPLVLCSGEPEKVEKYGGIHKTDGAKALKSRIAILLERAA